MLWATYAPTADCIWFYATPIDFRLSERAMYLFRHAFQLDDDLAYSSTDRTYFLVAARRAGCAAVHLGVSHLSIGAARPSHASLAGKFRS